MEERRRNPRVKTINLLSYISLDENGKPLEQGMGRALDISQGGLLMETQVPINARYLLLIAADINEELVKIKGGVVYSSKTAAKNFHTGVRFIETNERIRKIVVEMIRVFSKQKLGGQ